MTEFERGDFVGIFIMALVCAAGWLLVCRIIPGLRNKPGVSYGIAIALSWVPCLAAAGGPNIYSVSATLICVALLCFTMLAFPGKVDELTTDVDKAQAKRHRGAAIH